MNASEQRIEALAEAPIVVGYDGSPAAVAAVRWAACEARRRGLRLLVVHAYLPPSLLGAMSLSGSAASIELLRDDAMTILAEGIAAAEAIAPTVPIGGRAISGSPARVLRDKASTAAMLVVGVSRARLLPGGIVGTVTARLAGVVPCPFIAVPPTPDLIADTHDDEDAQAPERAAVEEPAVTAEDQAVPSCRRPVLVGLDGSPVSERALAFAFEAADQRKVPLLAVRVWDDMATEAAGLGNLVDRDAVDAQQAGELSKQLHGWAEKYPGVELVSIIRRGHPVGALVRFGSAEREPGLIVVGSRGRGGFAGMVLGSTGQGVIAHAMCPVAIVHHPH